MDTKPRAARRLLTRFLTAAGIAAGIAAVSSAQQPTAPRQRAAVLLPPRPLDPAEKPPVARGAIDDTPSFPTPPATKWTTPSPSPAAAASGPAWLSGSPDPNVRQAGTTVRPFPTTPSRTAPTQTEEPPSFMSRGMDKIKNAVGIEKQPAPPTANRNAPGQPGREIPTANTPFQGTAANGAPVYAGPPAYRWFGYGSVTPGANSLAPDGQYPKPSAEWHRLTGATPGAIPVPVTNPGRSSGGVEPPNYQQPVIRTQAPTSNPQPVSATMPQDTTRFVSTPVYHEPRYASSPPVDAPKPAPDRLPSMPMAPAAPPVGVPTMSAPPMMQSNVALPTMSPVPEKPRPAVVPSVTPEFSPASTDAPSNWTKPANADGSWQPGATNTTAQTIARAQAPQAQQADPVITLIQNLCRNRATGVDVRYVGTKKLSVCFETKTEADARRLAKDISNRQELVPFQIDFCVLLK